MKKALLLLAMSVRLCAQQAFDFSSLDKLASVAKNKTIVTLNGDMLKLAANIFGDDSEAASLKSLVNNLKGIYVRVYELGKEGQYSEADLAPLRAILKSSPWSRIVESVEDNESAEVWVQPLPNNRLGGVAVIATEPKELTVVFIDGALNMKDLANLSGNLGIPEFKLDSGHKKSADKGSKEKKEEE